MTTNNAEVLAYLTQEARRSAADSAALVVKRCDEFAADMRRYADRLATCENDKERADVLNWMLHAAVSNLLPNMRLDMVAKAQAELTTVARMQYEADKANATS